MVRRLWMPVVVLVALLGVLWIVISPVYGAPTFANLLVDNEIRFTSPGFNTAHDINVVDNAGALRFYACPQLTVTPQCAAIQFFGNFANTFGGQLFLDSGAETNAAIIFRTALANNAITERMRVAGNGNVGMGTTPPTALLNVVGSQPITVTSGFGTNALPVFEVIGAKGGNSEGLGFAAGNGADVNIRAGDGGDGNGRVPAGGQGGSITLQPGLKGSSSAGPAGTDGNLSLAPSGGNVGIGTTTPQSTLQVVGNYIQYPTISGSAPPVADCDAIDEAGRTVVRTDSTTNLYICTGAGGWVGK